MLNGPPCINKVLPTYLLLVSYAAVGRSSRNALPDDAKNGCVEDYFTTTLLQCLLDAFAVFFSLPIGAELPLYYTHKQGMEQNLSRQLKLKRCFFNYCRRKSSRV